MNNLSIGDTTQILIGSPTFSAILFGKPWTMAAQSMKRLSRGWFLETWSVPVSHWPMMRPCFLGPLARPKMLGRSSHPDFLSSIATARLYYRAGFRPLAGPNSSFKPNPLRGSA